MNHLSLKATIISIVEGSATVELEDGQRLTFHAPEGTKLSAGQSVWMTISDSPFDPTQQPKEVLNTVFGNT